MSIAFNPQFCPGCILEASLRKYNSVRNYRAVRTKVLGSKEQLLIDSHYMISPQVQGPDFGAYADFRSLVWETCEVGKGQTKISPFNFNVTPWESLLTYHHPLKMSKTP